MPSNIAWTVPSSLAGSGEAKEIMASTSGARQLLAVAAGRLDGGAVVWLAPEPGAGTWNERGQVAIPQPLHAVGHPGGRWVYVASAAGAGAVVALRRTAGGGLEPVGDAPSEGAGPCHLAVAPGGRYLLAANYDGGTVAVRALAADGRLGACTDVAELPAPGRSADPERQDGAHPHQVRFDPAGRHLLVCDLGGDRVWAFGLDGRTGRLHLAGASALPAGCGPRNLTFVPGVPGEVYVACELDSTVLRCGYDPQTGALTPRHVVPAGERRTTRNYPGVIAASPRHACVYVANRGNDTVATVSARPGTGAGPALGAVSADGGLAVTVTEAGCGGSWPMDLAVVGETLLVANRDTGNVAMLALDPLTGAVGHRTGGFDVPGPVSVLLARRPGADDLPGVRG